MQMGLHPTAKLLCESLSCTVFTAVSVRRGWRRLERQDVRWSGTELSLETCHNPRAGVVSNHHPIRLGSFKRVRECE